MENCTWTLVDGSSIVADDYGPWAPSTKEAQRFVTELADYLGLPLDTVANMADDEFVVVQHKTSGRLLAVFPGTGDILEQYCPVGAGMKGLWFAGLGAVGAGLGYLATRGGYGNQMVPIGVGAAAGLVGAFFLTKAAPRTLAGSRIPRQAIPASRGAMAGVPRQVIPGARGPIAGWPARVIPASRGAVGSCGGCGPQVY